MDYLFILFYVYAPIPELSEVCQNIEFFCSKHEIKGRIRISGEGSNGIIGGTYNSMRKFESYIVSYGPFIGANFQFYRSGIIETSVSKQKFDALSVKVTKEVVSLDLKYDIWEKVVSTKPGNHLSPQVFHQYLEAVEQGQLSHDEVRLIDVRNLYETRIGRFEGRNFNSIDPQTRQFSDFTHFVDHNLDDLKDKKVLMYCTGGVRCERASAYLKYKGIDDVNQLHGGIHAYQTMFGDQGYFRGKNFVFDPRGAISNRDAQSQEWKLLNGVNECNYSSNNVSERELMNIESSAIASAAIEGSDRVDVDVIGKCLLCACAYDDYSAHTRCRKCRMLVLICADCRSRHRSQNDLAKLTSASQAIGCAAPSLQLLNWHASQLAPIGNIAGDTEVQAINCANTQTANSDNSKIIETVSYVCEFCAKHD